MLRKSQQLANILLTYSLTIEQNETVFIYAEDTHEWFIKLLCKRIEELGAYAIVYLFNLKKRKALIEEDNPQKLSEEKNYILSKMKKSQSMIEIISLSDPIYLNNTTPEKIAHFNTYIVSEIVQYKLGDGKDRPAMKWVLAEVPCKGQAEFSGMSEEKYANYLYRSTNIDWRKENRHMQKIKEIFDNGNQIRIVVPALTDFTFSLEGRGGYIEDGHINMPGGEVFYAPIEDSAEGYITFNAPIIKNAIEIKEIRLEFKKGKVTHISAKKNESVVQELLKLPGAKKIGEFAVGTNYKIKKYAKNISFDEKIGGTFHIALGNAYPFLLSQGGGLNKSPLHWDIVCDLRKKGKSPGGKYMLMELSYKKTAYGYSLSKKLKNNSFLMVT